MKILFIGNTRLGDAVLSTPIINHYDKKENHITVICSPLSKEVYSSFSAVKEIISLKKKKRGGHWIEAYLNLKKIKWDLIIDLRDTILSRLIRKSKILRFSNKNNYNHKVIDYCKLIDLKFNKSPFLPTNYYYKNSVQSFIKNKNITMPILAVAPFTNWQRKDWPLNSYLQLLKKLLEKKKYFESVVLLGSKDDKDKCQRFKKEMNDVKVYNLAASLKILEIFELLKLCKLFVGNDSGLSHLAAAANTKTLTLFGPSRNEIYRPWGKNSFYIRTPETYEELVHVKGYSRFDTASLMEGLKVEDVYKKCLSIISK